MIEASARLMTLAELETVLEPTVAEMVSDGGRWIMVIERDAEPVRYLQLMAVEKTGSPVLAEVISDCYLEGDERLSAAETEGLRRLGWEVPDPEKGNNWTKLEETPDVSLRDLTSRILETVSSVFGCSVEVGCNVSWWQSFEWWGSDRRDRPIPSEDDPEIATFSSLLDVVGAPDAESLIDMMQDHTDDPWIDFDNSGTRNLTICVECRGTVLVYPFVLSEFWDTLAELNSEINERNEWDRLADEIETAEGFRVEIERWPSGTWQEVTSPKAYPYKRAAADNTTVAAWLRTRFRRNYRDYEIAVLRPDGGRVRGQVRLKTLRHWWQLAEATS